MVETWLWLAFIVAGVLMAALELVFGVDTGLDLVLVGSSFILGGLVAWILDLWLAAPVTTAIVCVAYLALGRRYVHRWTSVAKERTNIDAIIGAVGITVTPVSSRPGGIVKVANEEWRATSSAEIPAGEEVVVKSVAGVTLTVERRGGSRQ